MEADEALNLISADEGQRMEFKTSFAEENAAIESLGAFANAKGGTVLIGVKDDRTVGGVDIGKNRLENFVNKLRRESEPPLSPIVDVVDLDGKAIVAITVDRPQPGQLFHVFRKPMIRVGRTNQVMSPGEQKARLVEGVRSDASDSDRPRFNVGHAGGTGLEGQFSPIFNVEQFSGDRVADLEWRITGSRFDMEWRHAEGAALDRTHPTNTFDLTFAASEPVIETDELAFMIRFHWRGSWRSEMHRWRIGRRELPNKVLWEVGTKLLPAIVSDEEEH